MSKNKTPYIYHVCFMAHSESDIEAIEFIKKMKAEQIRKEDNRFHILSVNKQIEGSFLSKVIYSDNEIKVTL